MGPIGVNPFRSDYIFNLQSQLLFSDPLSKKLGEYILVMIEKLCWTCKELKSVDEFYKQKTSQDGYVNHCKACVSLKYYEKKLGVNQPPMVRWLKESLRKEGLKDCTKCGEVKSLDSFYKVSRGKRMRLSSRCKQCARVYKRENRAVLNKKKYRNPKKDRDRERKSLDRRIRHKLRKRLYNANFEQGISSRTNDSNLGCNIQYLIKYLEGRFYPNSETGEAMTWGNRGSEGWHIDHVIPLAKFNLEDKEQYRAASNFRNVKPMWYLENREKQSEIILEELDEWHFQVCHRFSIELPQGYLKRRGWYICSGGTRGGGNIGLLDWRHDGEV